MPANNKNNYSQEDTESSPLMGQPESCDVIWKRFKEQYKFHLAGVWTLIILGTATITYFTHLHQMNAIDPNKCTSDRSKKSALVLSVLFGLVGADRFYLGYPILGALKVITGGVGGIWWVYDLVLISMGVLIDANGCNLQ